MLFGGRSYLEDVRDLRVKDEIGLTGSVEKSWRQMLHIRKHNNDTSPNLASA